MLLPRRFTLLGTLVFCLVVVIASNTVDARRSRIDLPIKNPSEAPLEDNLATASGNESEVVPAVAVAEPLTSNKDKDKDKEKEVPAPVVTEAPLSDIKEESSTDIASEIDNDEDEDKTETPPDVPTVEDCEPDNIGYEIVTGYDFYFNCLKFLFFQFFRMYRYVFSAPGKLLDSIPGTLMLTDCLDSCTNNDSCSSVNYETGLCVLFSSNADKLPGKC